MTRTKLAVLCATGLAALIAAGSIAPAFADDHDRGRHEERRPDRDRHDRGYGYARPVYAPPAVYAPVAPVYAPPIAPSLNVVVPLRF